MTLRNAKHVVFCLTDVGSLSEADPCSGSMSADVCGAAGDFYVFMLHSSTCLLCLCSLYILGDGYIYRERCMVLYHLKILKILGIP